MRSAIFRRLPIWDPDGAFRRRWDVFVLFLAVAAATIAPVAVAFQIRATGLYLVLDIVITLVFSADIFVALRTAYTEDSRWVKDPRRIARRYVRGWFWPDAVTAFPFFLLPAGRVATLARLVRVARLARIAKTATGMRSIHRVRNRSTNPYVIRFVLLVFWLLLTAHFIACGFIVVGGVPYDLSPSMRYLQAFYWTVTTLATVGYGDITPDTGNPIQLAFTVIAQFAGVAMYGFVIGNISNLIAHIDLAKTQHRDKMERINAFLKHRRISDSLTRRINEYYAYLWETRRGYDESTVIADLPHGLREHVVLELNRDVIRKVPIFHGAESAFIREVSMNLVPAVYTPGDYVVRAGEIGEEMFFISRGSVDVVSQDESTVYATLTDGQFFGEIALLSSTPRTATIKAREYCDLYSLHRTAFERVLSRYPTFADQVKELAEQRRRETEAASRR